MYGLFYLASIGKFGEMPDFRQLENPKTNLATEIISSGNSGVFVFISFTGPGYNFFVDIFNLNLKNQK